MHQFVTMSRKKFFDLTKDENIEEIHRLLMDDDEDEIAGDVEEEIVDSDGSSSEDNVETRSVESDTDHDISEEEEIEDAVEEETNVSHFLGK